MGVVPIFRKSLSQNVRESLRSYFEQLRSENIEKLPPEAELAQKLSVSRGTIRQALDDLEKEGLVLRIHGRGTFLNPNGFQVKANMNTLLEFGNVIQLSGYESSSEIVSVEKSSISGYIAHCLQLDKDCQAFRVVRVYYADNSPAIFSLAFIPVDIFESNPDMTVWKDFTNFEVIRQKCGRLIIRDQVEVSAVTLADAEKEIEYPMKNMPNALLRLEACGFDQDNVPVIYGIAYYDTDLVRFQLFRES